ncbi:hypothetical protein [Acidisphaera rubrifaciens]|uniref:Transcriptional regulator TetR n=1 Tax=Acidisphaera rubrifaciens HS-AP3 TaxID=1231350 RepID=A0A0D6P7Y2_9PROT|nr:hypothetical protein [Acidisphaera rubrifaciens]GAN77880.1 transcriptional regulator TetR [Acidisphaera rubrifaciens HS-AP3]
MNDPSTDRHISDRDFDAALVGAAMAIAGEKGWRAVSVVRAAQRAGLDLARARARFPGSLAILMRFGVMADQAALTAAAAATGPVRDRLFDMIMQRFDVLQAHRDGVRAVLRHLPSDPPLALLMTMASKRSMAWLLDGAGVGTTGLRGALRVRGLLAVWLYAVRAWEHDDSADLSATMRAVDAALGRAEEAERMLHPGRPATVKTEDHAADPGPAVPEAHEAAAAAPVEPPPPPEPPAAPPAEPPPPASPQV